MKVKKKVTIPASTRVQTVEVVCDLCGDKRKGSGNDWSTGFDQSEVEIRYCVGRNFPEGGSGFTITIDLCPGCFLNRLVPFIEHESETRKKLERVAWDW